MDWEGALITQEIYDARSKTLKFVPILFSTDESVFVPDPLRSQTHYVLDSEASYGALYDVLLDQAGVEPRAVGSPKRKERAKGKPSTFGEASAAPTTKADISRIIRYAPAELIGRGAETK